MADGVILNANTSTGATMATDDAGAAGHVQLMKLAISTDGSASLVPADGTNGIYVNVRNVNGNLTIVGPAADGAAVSGNPVRIAGSDGTNTQDISVTTSGHVHIHDGGNTITVDGTVGVSGTVTVDGSGVTQPVSNAGLTALNGAISGSEVQVDVVTSALPSGAATAAKQPALGTAGTPSADVISIQGVASGTVVPVSDGGGTLTVDGTVSVTGVATAANQTTVIGHLDGVEGLLTTIDADTGGIATSAATVAGAVSGTEMQVDVVAALPAGTNNIGDVDVLSVVPGTGATNLGKAEDSAHTTGDVGVMALVVRQDSQTALGADGDYVPPTVDSAGGLRVSIVAGAGSGGTAAADDADFTAGTTQGTPAMGVYESTPTSVTDGDLGTVGITATRALKVNLRDASGNEVSVGGGTQYTEGDTDATLTGTVMMMEGAANAAVPAQGTAADGLLVNLGANNDVTVTNAGTFAVQVDGAALTALQLIDDPVATLGTTTYTETSTKGMIVGAVRRDADTTLVDTTNEIGPLQMDANGRLKVEAFSGETLPVSLASVPSHAVTNAGTFAVQVDGAALTALQLIDNPVLVDDAAFTPATSSVMMAGFEADEASTDSVDEGDAGAARMTLDRKVIVTPQPHTTGGLSIFRSLDLDETEEDVKTSAGQVYGWAVTNTATSTRWLKFYNATAANVTVGTTTPVITWGIPGNSSDDVSANVLGAMGIAFDTAISVAATTGVADNDTGAPSANDVIVNVFYR